MDKVGTNRITRAVNDIKVINVNLKITTNIERVIKKQV